jgi:hypothetical protein
MAPGVEHQNPSLACAVLLVLVRCTRSPCRKLSAAVALRQKVRLSLVRKSDLMMPE